MTRICDYEGSRYKSEFWENSGRQYEDLAERIALKKMLPPRGKRLIEVGAGFGRMADMYKGYNQVVLVDYARTQLEEAQRYLGPDERFIFVAADVYNMPFVENMFDALVMIRVMHHLVNAPAALQELNRITSSNGAAIVEFASKRHLKAILRWLLRRQNWNPFDQKPHEFVELNIDFHPAWVKRQFADASFAIQDIRTLSHFRLPILKKILPAQFLATLDGWVQPTGQWWQYTPSIFMKVIPQKDSIAEAKGFFRCPACHSSSLEQTEDALICQNCQRQWGYRDGIYDFKTPLAYRTSC